MAREGVPAWRRQVSSMLRAAVRLETPPPLLPAPGQGGAGSLLKPTPTPLSSAPGR